MASYEELMAEMLGYKERTDRVTPPLQDPAALRSEAFERGGMTRQDLWQQSDLRATIDQEQQKRREATMRGLIELARALGSRSGMEDDSGK